MALHNHILLNGYVSRPPSDTNRIKIWLRELVEAIDMKIIQGPFADYVEVEGNRGLTAAVMIETSHIALHIWDEEDPALIQFDLYTCGELPVQKVIESLDDEMTLLNYRYMVMERHTGFNVIETKVVELSE
jgi:S-adenosylmethionine/arginine decarboxylase-like enzyme